MIDTHNHILPGLDDGAADIAESIEIARTFVAEGVTLVVATPHFNTGDTEPPKPERVRALVVELQAELDRVQIPLQVLPGNEVFLDRRIPRLLLERGVLSLGGSKAVLIEVWGDHSGAQWLETFQELQAEGFQPILAHPERVEAIQRCPDLAAQFTDSGVLLQLTAPAFFGDHGPAAEQTSRELLQRGLYSLAASDRHHPWQPRSLRRLHSQLQDLGGAELAELLLEENPRRVLAGEPVLAVNGIAV